MKKRCAKCKQALAELPGPIAIEFVGRRLQEEYLDCEIGWTATGVFIEDERRTDIIVRAQALLEALMQRDPGFPYNGNDYCFDCYENAGVAR